MKRDPPSPTAPDSASRLRRLAVLLGFPFLGTILRVVPLGFLAVTVVFSVAASDGSAAPGPLAAAPGASAAPDSAALSAPLDAFDALLQRYVTDDGVRYGSWAAGAKDVAALSSLIDGLEAMTLSAMAGDDALAVWIDLYNAATLELVLAHYPVESIKDTAGILKSPWNRKVVTVEGRELSLDDIENDIIRARFPDARVHFALNCASRGCPPLARTAFRGETLDEQLDAACRRALNDPRWVRIEGGRVVLSKLFDWYRKDFERDAGSLGAFIAPFLDDERSKAAMLAGPELEFEDYDWSLNRAPETAAPR